MKYLMWCGFGILLLIAGSAASFSLEASDKEGCQNSEFEVTIAIIKACGEFDRRLKAAVHGGTDME